MTTELPTTLKIGAHDYKIEWFTHATGDALKEWGFCHVDEQTIGLSKRMGRTKAAETFLHELLHALTWLFDLEAKQEAEEHYVCRLARGLTIVFRDNPALLPWLRESVEDGI